MAINVNRLDVGALAGLASRGTPNLNLPLFGVDYSGYGKNILAAALANQQANTQLAGYQNQANIAQMQEGGAMARNQNTLATQLQMAQEGNQNQMAISQMTNDTRMQDILQQGQIAQGQLGLGYNQLAQQSQYQQGQLGIQNKQLDINQQLADQEYARNQIEAMKLMKQMDLAKLGAASTIGLMGINQYSSDPAKQEAFKSKWISQQVEDGVLDKGKADQLMQASPEDFAKYLMQNTIYSSIAASQHGAQMGGMLPNMTNIYGNLGAGEKVTTESKAGAAEAGRSLLDINAALVNFPSELFTRAGQAKVAVGTELGQQPEWVQNVANKVSETTGITPTVENMTELKAQKEAFAGNLLQSIMSTLAQQRGSQFSEKSIHALKPEVPIVGEDTKESAFAKLVTLQQRMIRAGRYQQDLVKQGIPADSQKYEDLVIKYIKSAPVPGKLSFIDPQGKEHNIGYKEVEAFAKGNGITEQEAREFFLTNQAKQ